MTESGDSFKPIYRFTWDDGTTCRTDNLENKADIGNAGVELLAELGRDDPECEVEWIGAET